MDDDVVIVLHTVMSHDSVMLLLLKMNSALISFLTIMIQCFSSNEPLCKSCFQQQDAV